MATNGMIGFLRNGEERWIFSKFDSGEPLQEFVEDLCKDLPTSFLHELFEQINPDFRYLEFYQPKSWAEYAYIVNLDNNTIEIYDVYTKKPRMKQDRYNSKCKLREIISFPTVETSSDRKVFLEGDLIAFHDLKTIDMYKAYQDEEMLESCLRAFHHATSREFRYVYGHLTPLECRCFKLLLGRMGEWFIRQFFYSLKEEGVNANGERVEQIEKLSLKVFYLS